MEGKENQELIKQYNRVYGEMLGRERRKRGISLEELSSGIMSRTALDRVEKGRTQWTKLAGDTLMLRMGILPEYFESLASGAELERWRWREDICLLVPERPGEAALKLKEYRGKYKKREPLEEQFLLKTEAVLILSGGYRMLAGASEAGKMKPQKQESGEAALDTARRAVDCTVHPGWEKKIGRLWLSPGELEAMLLVSAALFGCGRKMEAWRLWEAVRNYPREHGWKERAAAMILPQTAVLGMRKASAAAAEEGLLAESAAAFGREALELLRSSGCHSYALPLLEDLCRLGEGGFGEKEYTESTGIFRDMFREIYEWFGYPGCRLWQGISVDNTRDVGTALKMLRKFYRRSREEAVYDGAEQVVTPRQLEKIEKGIHKPSYENYDRLARQYGKTGGWNMPLLETDSIDVLERRQAICKMIEHKDWVKAECETERFARQVDGNFPRARQEVLFFEAALRYRKEGNAAKGLDRMLEAFCCTVPDFDGRDLKWWVFQREEIMIAANVGSLYCSLGKYQKAKEWLEAVIFSVEQQSRRTGICSYGYDIAIESYSSCLGALRRFAQAVKVVENAVAKELALCRINSIQDLFYHIAWNAYEAAVENPETYGHFWQKWRKAFWLSQSMAEFMHDSHLKVFLERRAGKYLS